MNFFRTLRLMLAGALSETRNSENGFPGSVCDGGPVKQPTEGFGAIAPTYLRGSAPSKSTIWNGNRCSMASG